MTVAELRRRLTGDEYTHWVAYYQIEYQEQKARMDAAKSKRN